MLPGEQMPAFVCPSLVGDQEKLFTSDKLAGKTTLLFFYSKDFGGDQLLENSFQNEFPAEGEACLDVMADLAASDEFDLELVAISTDSIPVHRWLLYNSGCQKLSLWRCQGVEGEKGGGRPHDHAGRQDWRGAKDFP